MSTVTPTGKPKQNQQPHVYEALDPDASEGYVWLMRCKVVRQTPKAIQLRHDGEVFWIPRAVIKSVRRTRRHKDYEINEAFARRNEVI